MEQRGPWEAAMPCAISRRRSWTIRLTGAVKVRTEPMMRTEVAITLGATPPSTVWGGGEWSEVSEVSEVSSGERGKEASTCAE